MILGGGTGGTLTANRLHRLLGREVKIVVVDRDDDHLYQPGLLFVPFGMIRPQGLVRSRRRQLLPGITFRQAAVDAVETSANTVHLEDGSELTYDVLVVATGAHLLPAETDGLTGPGWREKVFSFYSLPDAIALRDALRTLRHGRLVVNLVDIPIKCPVAPLEFTFLADWYLREAGVRDHLQITYATPLDAAFTTPVAATHLAGMLEQKEITLESEFSTGRVDGEGGRLISWDDREVPFDLLVTVPLHGGAPFVTRSPGLGDELGFVATDPHTLQATVAPNVFAIGDATNLPTSKAGSATHFEGETLAANIKRYLGGEGLEAGYDGHVNCFIETGFHQALLVDFNYEHEPVAGRFPAPHIGPLPLLRPSRLNHLAKLAFQSIYWHVLLPGRDIPGVGAQMPMAGKRLATPTGAPR